MSSRRSTLGLRCFRALSNDGQDRRPFVIQHESHRSCLTWICELAMASKNTHHFLDPSLKLYHWVLPLIKDNSNVHFPHPLSCLAYLNGKLMLTLFCWVLIQHFCTARPCFGLCCSKQLRNECSAGEATYKPIQPGVLSPAALGDCA